MRLHLGLLFLCLAASAAPAADWPQWLGPNRDGSTAENAVPWKGDLQLVWKKPVSDGNSSPIVAAGVCYLFTKVKDKDAEMVQAFDAKTGDLKWEKAYNKAAFKPFFGIGPRSTPCLVDGKLFTFGNTGVLTCWNAADGRQIWQKDTLAEYKDQNLMFGLACSPIVVDGKVMVMVGKNKTGVVAFHVKDGSAAWQATGDPASYSSPIVFGMGAKRQIVFLTGANVLSLSPSGEVLWKQPFVDSLSESSTTPIKVGDVLIASSVKNGSIGLNLIESAGKPAASQAWKNPDLTCYFSTPVAADAGHVFMATGVASLTAASITLRCVEVGTGKEVWKKPNVGKFHAALLKCGNGNLLLSDDAGNLLLLAPNVKEYKELCRAKVSSGGWAQPALANGLLILRDDKDLYCYKLPATE